MIAYPPGEDSSQEQKPWGFYQGKRYKKPFFDRNSQGIGIISDEED
jgi:hypothetical protein